MPDLRNYLDHNASAPLVEEARMAMVAAFDHVGNPSSVHSEGRASRALIEAARRDVAALVGAPAGNVVFTSGATEGAATLLTPRYREGRTPLAASHLYVGATEHPCVLAGGGFGPGTTTIVPVDADGTVDRDALRRALAAHDTQEGVPLVAVQMANNETGVVQPIEEIAEIVHEAGGLFVVDAVQAAGRIPVDISVGYADFLILSSHKLGGPKGIGAIVARSTGIMPEPLVGGGGQEKGHRAGTEALVAIAGFGAAAREAAAAVGRAARLARLRDMAEAGVRAIAPDAIVHGDRVARLPNTLFFTVPGLKAETAQIAFDLAGVALSAGSACSSGKVGPSHVLAAMGVLDGPGALRVSVGQGTSGEDIERFLEALGTIVARKGRIAAPYAA